jgi:hypothetical protein
MSLLPVGVIPPSDYGINNSLRFRSSASAYLSRTPASAGNRQTWTWSGWVKRGNLQGSSTAVQMLFGNAPASGSNTTQLRIGFYQDSFVVGLFTVYALVTTQLFRDPSAWYHFVVALDTTQATAANRLKIYVNGQQITSFSTNNIAANIAQNSSLGVNNNVSHSINSSQPLNGTEYFDSYQTEVNFIDGQAFTPSSFGETDTTTGVWKPKAYTGTYSTNGFYLKFADASAATAAAIGKDSSGNGNNWTPSGISVTAGTTYDSMTDSPTLTSATVANYCVLNPINRLTTATLSNANLAFTTATTGHNAIGSIGMSSGDYYWEAETSAGTTQARATVYGTAASTYYSFAANNTVYGFRFDADAGTLDYTTDGSSFTSLATGLTSAPYFPYFNNNGVTSKTISVNFGQRPFTYTPPTGYKRLNTFNLPDSTIVKGNSYMDATTYTGTGASLSVTNAAGFRPDFVWVKGRSGATANALYDFVRGTTKDLVSNTTAAETTQAQGLTAFNSNGFTVGTLAKMNTNAATYVGWQWVGSNSSVSNTSGTITSTVDANTTAGFSIVTYTGIGTAGTVGHGLGVAPKFVIVKPRSSANSWVVWTQALTGSQYLLLNQTDVVGTSSTTWNATVPTSTVFSVGLNDLSTNANGVTHVAYCWSEIAGFSKFGSYTGNGNANGTFVYTGFIPKFILIKNISAANNWNIFDSTRDPFNVVDLSLQPNLSTAEFTEADLDILSNGFKLRVTNAGLNGNTNTLIYMAFAENPFKNSLAR